MKVYDDDFRDALKVLSLLALLFLLLYSAAWLVVLLYNFTTYGSISP